MSVNLNNLLKCSEKASPSVSKTGEWISQVLPAAGDQCPLRRAAPVAQLEVEGFCVGSVWLRSVLWPPCWRGHE